MRLSARLTLALVCCVPVLTYACSDSTNPDSSQDAPHLAIHFDSLYTQAADSGSVDSRGLILTYLEFAAALGATPGNVTVTTADGTEHWKGYELEDVTSGVCSQDSSYLLIAYRESDVHTALLAFFDGSGSLEEDVGVITNDTLIVAASGGQGSTTRSSLGGSCSSISASLTNPNMAEFNIASCELAGFQTSFSLTIPSVPDVDPALASLSVNAQSFKGIRGVDAQDAATVRRAHAMFLAKRNSKKL